jgi:hypothetical protein
MEKIGQERFWIRHFANKIMVGKNGNISLEIGFLSQGKWAT